MVESEELEVWNLTHGMPVQTGAQELYNIVGRLKAPETVSRFTYRLNDGPEKLIFFNNTGERCGRLERPGDFSIDTIRLEDLQPDNHLTLRIYRDGQSRSGEPVSIDFPACPPPDSQPAYQMVLDEAISPEQIGQIVDGKWRVSRDEEGVPCLEIRKEDAGYDRIILFGRHDWTSSYEVNATLCVREWTNKIHNVGLLFKWNSHHPGDGSNLPTRWSTGLGYYYSRSLGLRLRFGVDVRYDEQGNKLGDNILAEAPLSMLEWRKNQLLKRFFPGREAQPVLKPGVHYRFRLGIHPARYTLAVWEDGQKQPTPQLTAPHPIERLPRGSVGIIAYHCAVRVYAFQVRPLPAPEGR
jgi:hypothetical protein